MIDVIEGNRKYIRCLYAYNKVDTITIEEVDKLAREPDSIVISVRMKLNLDRCVRPCVRLSVSSAFGVVD